MSKQVLDISQMQHLQELGIELKETMLYWARCVDNDPRAATHYGKWVLIKGNNAQTVGLMHWEFIPAYTLQDILDLLPKSTKYGQLQIRFCEYPNGNYGNEVVYDSMAHNGITFFCENVIDSAYEMLCLCIKEGFVKTNKED